MLVSSMPLISTSVLRMVIFYKINEYKLKVLTGMIIFSST